MKFSFKNYVGKSRVARDLSTASSNFYVSSNLIYHVPHSIFPLFNWFILVPPPIFMSLWFITIFMPLPTWLFLFRCLYVSPNLICHVSLPALIDLHRSLQLACCIPSGQFHKRVKLSRTWFAEQEYLLVVNLKRTESMLCRLFHVSWPLVNQIYQIRVLFLETSKQIFNI